MNLNIYTYRIQTLLQESKNILILLRKEPDLDLIGASLSFYLSLTQKGKQVTIVCPDKMMVSHSNLFAVDKITDELSKKGKNLVISFPYAEGSIEKVSYNIENNRFNLVIEPRGEGINLLNKEVIEFSRSGEGADNFDVVLAFGVSNISELGKLQALAQKILSEKPVISINNSSNASTFGTISINSPDSPSVSEITALLLSRLNLPIDRDIAGNLISGIKEKTQNFIKDVTADTFEAAAICMRKTSEKIQETPQPWRQPQSTGVVKISGQGQATIKNAPPDWLKPKIFRSSGFGQNPDDGDDGSVL